MEPTFTKAEIEAANRKWWQHFINVPTREVEIVRSQEDVDRLAKRDTDYLVGLMLDARPKG